MRTYKRRIKDTFVKMHGDEYGSIFFLLILPILISLISQWIAKWIIDRTDMASIRGQAFDALTELSPSSMARLTSTSMPPQGQRKL